MVIEWATMMAEKSVSCGAYSPARAAPGISSVIILTLLMDWPGDDKE